MFLLGLRMPSSSTWGRLACGPFTRGFRQSLLQFCFLALLINPRSLAAVRLGTTILGVRNILPPEVRNAVTRMCANLPRAAHYFATYLDNSHEEPLRPQ